MSRVFQHYTMLQVLHISKFLLYWNIILHIVKFWVWSELCISFWSNRDCNHRRTLSHEGCKLRKEPLGLKQCLLWKIFWEKPHMYSMWTLEDTTGGYIFSPEELLKVTSLRLVGHSSWQFIVKGGLPKAREIYLSYLFNSVCWVTS